jgi:hypothetical protein
MALFVYHCIVMFPLARRRRHGGGFLHSFVNGSANDSDQCNWADATHSAGINRENRGKTLIARSVRSFHDRVEMVRVTADDHAKPERRKIFICEGCQTNA